MAETNMTAFANSCAGYVHSFILTPIVQHLTGKGVQCSLEELAGVLQLPAARAPAMPGPAIPAMAFGGAVPAMAAAVAPTAARKNTATDNPVAGRTCIYQYKRGQSKGKFCGKAVAAGSDFCNTCLKQRKNLHKEAPGAAPGAAPGMGIPGMAGLPPGYNPPIAAAAPTATAPARPGELSVAPFDPERGLFKEPNHHFIVCQVSPGVVAVIGRHDEAENRIVPLTDQEKATAQQYGLILAENNQAIAPAPAPSPIPAVAAQIVQAVPAIPTGPALPVIPPLATADVGGAIPQLPAIPQIPGIPQIPV